MKRVSNPRNQPSTHTRRAVRRAGVLAAWLCLAIAAQAELLTHLTFDEANGSIVPDRWGTHDGMLSPTGATLVDGGVLGKAVSITDGYVSLGSALSFVDTDFSICLWVKTALPSGTQGVLFSHHVGWGGNNGYFLQLNAGYANLLSFYSGSLGVMPVSQTAINDNVWHFVAVVYRRGGSASLYVDGIPAQDSKPGSVIVDADALFLLGGVTAAAPTRAMPAFTGLLDELQVFDHALGDEEVSFYRANPGAQPKAPAAYWRFDETSGTTAKDSMGNYAGALSAAGAAFVSGGVAGNALSLDRAANGFVQVGDVLRLDDSDFSLSAWIKTKPGDATDGLTILSKVLPGSANGYLLGVNRSGLYGAVGKAMFSDSAAPGSELISQTPVNDGNWHHVVSVHRKGGDKSIYVDGTPAEATASGRAIVPTAAPLRIGASDAGSFDGWIDDVQIYDRFLGPAEVDHLFTHPGAYLGPQPRVYSVFITPNGGLFTNSVSVSLSSPLLNAAYLFTLDDTDPTLAHGTVYSGAFEVTETLTVSARAFTNGVPATEIARATFTRAPQIAFSPPAGLFTNAIDVSLATYIVPAEVRYTVDGTEPVATSPLFTQAIHLAAETTIKARLFFNGFAVSEIFAARYLRVYALDDGIPASWREQYFGTGYLTDPRVAADADPDQDGLTNLQEYRAGTSPLDPLSGVVVGIRAVPLLSWNSVPGLHYRVLRKPNFQSSDWTILEEIIAADALSTFVDTSAMDAAGFYVVQPLSP